MNSMFRHADAFNGKIGAWDVSNVTDMNCMFECATRASSFNQDIGDWDVSSVIDMGHLMFRQAFNQDIGAWDVSSVTNMNGMFAYAILLSIKILVDGM